MCVIWGVPYLLIRVSVRELTPATLVFVRTLISTAILLPIALARGELRPVLSRWRPLLVFAAIEVAIPWILLSSAERRISSSLAALLIAAVPFVGVAAAALTGGERFDSRRLAGLAVGAAGVALIVGLDLGHTSAVAVVDAPIAATQLPASVPSGRVLASVAALAVVCTALAFVLFFELIAEVGPVRSTVITYVNPAVAALLGVAVLGERFTAGMAAGFVLVLAGSALAT